MGAVASRVGLVVLIQQDRQVIGEVIARLHPPGKFRWRAVSKAAVHGRHQHAGAGETQRIGIGGVHLVEGVGRRNIPASARRKALAPGNRDLHA